MSERPTEEDLKIYLKRLEVLMTNDTTSMYFECPKYIVNGLLTERIYLEAERDRLKAGHAQGFIRIATLESKVEWLEQQLAEKEFEFQEYRRTHP